MYGSGQPYRCAVGQRHTHDAKRIQTRNPKESGLTIWMVLTIPGGFKPATHRVKKAGSWITRLGRAATHLHMEKCERDLALAYQLLSFQTHCIIKLTITDGKISVQQVSAVSYNWGSHARTNTT